MQRWIIHLDMDEFFAAVEKLDEPSLRGQCLLIGSPASQRGVVATASYEARQFGCRSAMPMAVAQRLCPQAIILPPRFERYSQLSDQVLGILGQFSPLVEPLSIDEAFVDITGTERLLGAARDVPGRIKELVTRCTGLTASVGLAPNKFLAKLASDLRKPDGLVVIEPDGIHAMLDPLPVTRLWGVGPAGDKQLERLGVRTISQLRHLEPAVLSRAVGQGYADHLLALANGLDDRPVHPDGQAKSIGQEQTFAQDLGDLDALRAVLLEQAQEVARRLRRHGLSGRTVSLKIRYGDFTTLSRSSTLGEPTNLTEPIWQAAQGLLLTWAKRAGRPLRLLGMTVSSLGRTGQGQQMLFEPPRQPQMRQLDAAMDTINERFGPGSVRRALGTSAPPPDPGQAGPHPKRRT